MDVILSSSVRRWRITGVTWLLMTRITAKQFTFNMYSDSKYIYYTNGQSRRISWWTSTDTHSTLFINQSSIPSSAFEILSLLQVLQLVLKFWHETFEVSNNLASLRYVGRLSNQGMSYLLKLTHNFFRNVLPAAPHNPLTPNHTILFPNQIIFRQQLTIPTICNLHITLVLSLACSSPLGLLVYGYSSPFIDARYNGSWNLKVHPNTSPSLWSELAASDLLGW